MHDFFKRHDGRPNYERLVLLAVLCVGAVAGLPDFVHGFYDGFMGL